MEGVGDYISLGYFEQEDVLTVIQYLQTVSFVSTVGRLVVSFAASFLLLIRVH